MLSFTPVWGVLTAFCAPAQLGTGKNPLERLGGMFPTEAHGAPGIKAGNPQRLIASSLLVRAKHPTPPQYLLSGRLITSSRPSTGKAATGVPMAMASSITN